MTHAIYNGNLELINFMFNSGTVNSKKIMKVPGLFSASEVNKLFPFYIAIAQDNLEMFEYFWTKHREDVQLPWTEETLQSLFKLLAKREASQYLSLFMRSKTTTSLFKAMSHQYRFSFVEELLLAKTEIMMDVADSLKTLTKKHAAENAEKISDSMSTSFDAD
jgi:hypothetical protein